MDKVKAADVASGMVQASYVQDGVWTPCTSWGTNQIVYDWGAIVAALLRNLQDGSEWHIGGMYFEFYNGADVDPVPTIDRADDVTYYTGLTGSADFLRVPLIATSGSNSDTDNFSEDNVATFHAQTTGVLGQRTGSPLAFTDAANSRVYGGALVAFRDFSDITQDVILSRYYFAPGSQVEKVASSQIGITWPVTFE
jgi:hypothetical protein